MSKALRERLAERLAETHRANTLSGAWAPDMGERLADAALSVLSALAEDGWKLVPVEASYALEFARMADGTVKVGYNPRTEEGGWTLVGDVTKSVIAIEAQRDQALRDLDAANQRLSNVFAALAALRALKEAKP